MHRQRGCLSRHMRIVANSEERSFPISVDVVLGNLPSSGDLHVNCSFHEKICANGATHSLSTYDFLVEDLFNVFIQNVLDLHFDDRTDWVDENLGGKVNKVR